MDEHLYDGQVISHSYNAGYHLLAAATSMGAVAIWSMHYIGNRAITMLQGQRDLEIEYSPAFTAGSFFLAIGVVALAFYLFNITQSVNFTGTMVGGFLTGAAVCGMHYTGQGGIINYRVSYDYKYVLGSAIIAVTATTIALGIFFYLKSTWTNNWVKRVLCASVLAVAVSGMHWIATIGTTYHYRRIDHKIGGLGRQATIIIVLCLALGCCMALMAIAFLSQKARRRSENQVEQVVLASVTFDEEGKVMVTENGLLPSNKIVDAYQEDVSTPEKLADLIKTLQAFEESFDVGHPVFAWIYRASHHWEAVAYLIPSMHAHVQASFRRQLKEPPQSETTAAGQKDQDNNDNDKEDEDFVPTFKELFCVAAGNLAGTIREPVGNLGVLFEGILKTGTIEKRPKRGIFSRMKTTSDPFDAVELAKLQGPFGRGQLLFLVRCVNKQEVAHLLAVGYNFVNIDTIKTSLARRMEITPDELSAQLRQMQSYCTTEKRYQPGVNLACFALRPKVQRGWDILVSSCSKNFLPHTMLRGVPLAQRQLELIKKMDNMTASQCLEYIDAKIKSFTQGQQDFLNAFHLAVTLLGAQVGWNLFRNARCIAKVFPVPCSVQADPTSRIKSELVAFGLIVDVHSNSPNVRYEFSSLGLFRTQQHVHSGSSSHEAFAQQVFSEFIAIADHENAIAQKTATSISSPLVSSPSTSQRKIKRNASEQWPRHRRTAKKWVGASKEDDSSAKASVAANPLKDLLKCVRVTQEVTVEVSERSSSGPELPMGNSIEISVAPAVDAVTFADELMGLVIEEGRKQVHGRLMMAS
ncbi:MAG: hypothetical protein Q9167_005595 [Letrouitia subvulpina]